ncbi:hypothetical protein KL86DYS2_10668 [uncultured Dysgonomonas sp.]|uniref:Uncharacterized protein n=1 Tax=uncultured Dysgonomonas sp. TaxID=206096 RepID=A0A212J4K5_9BACT|nr:hypothetical protein KL86DYS2_10668 [uncultured Dysgonomonas sp.]
MDENITILESSQKGVLTTLSFLLTTLLGGLISMSFSIVLQRIKKKIEE